MQTNDPPTGAQVSVMIERINNMVEDIKEMRASQARTEALALAIASVQKDVEHHGKEIEYLFESGELRLAESSKIDKRLTGLERWQKIVSAAVLVAAGMIGWGVQRIEYLYKMDTRIQILELLVNQHNVERAVQPPATSSK